MPQRVRTRLVARALLVTTLVLSPFSLFTAHAATPSPILIGEIAWAGSSLSTADEWLELWNTGTATTSLAGWSIRGAGEGGKSLPLPIGATIPPHGTYVISNYATADIKSVLAIESQVVTTTISLSNSALKVELLDPSGNVVDTAGTGGVPSAGASLPEKLSMIRNGDQWASANSSTNLKAGILDLATPGVCDGCVYVLDPTPTLDTPEQASTISDPVPTTQTLTEPVSVPVIIETSDLIATEIITVTESPSSTETVIVESPTVETQTTSTDVEPVPFEAITYESVQTDPPASEIIDPTQTATTVTSTAPDTAPTSTIFTDATTDDETSTLSQTDDVVQSSITSLTPNAVKPAYTMLRLSEVTPYPMSDKEWLEITTLDATNVIALDGCTIHDAQGRILTISKATLDPAYSKFLVIQLSSARLNNDGDVVTLYDPNGQLLDTMTYTKTTKGASWIRFPDQAENWQQTLQPSPGSANIFAALTQNTDTSATTPNAQPKTIAPISSSTTPHISQTLIPRVLPVAASTKNSSVKKSVLPKTKASATTSVPPIPRTAPAAKVAKKTPTTTVKNTPAPIHRITFDMLNNDGLTAQRILLHGTVATPPGFFRNRSFVLQAQDGRGILVTAPANQRLPDINQSVSVVGTITFDERNIPSIKIGAKDRWTTNGTSTTPVIPRLVDLLAPATEDAWSLMRVTGTVMSVKGKTIHLDLDDAELDVVIRPGVGYRAERLKPGDVIVVSGVLDTTGDTPLLLPRRAEEIHLVSHAPPVIDPKSALVSHGPQIPSWSPLGAAGGAIAVTEGAKQFHRRRKQKRLEQRLAAL